MADILHDKGVLNFDNGDKYEGEFELKKKDKSIKAQGYGVYTTADGQIYSGVWHNNKFAEDINTVIQFQDGSVYDGFLVNWMYNGASNYTFPDESSLQAHFVDNMPVGALTLRDPNYHNWFATADDGFAWFQPANHYYDSLEIKLQPMGE